jgi:hypothetical protein
MNYLQLARMVDQQPATSRFIRNNPLPKINHPLSRYLSRRLWRWHGSSSQPHSTLDNPTIDHNVRIGKVSNGLILVFNLQFTKRVDLPAPTLGPVVGLARRSSHETLVVTLSRSGSRQWCLATNQIATSLMLCSTKNATFSKAYHTPYKPFPVLPVKGCWHSSNCCITSIFNKVICEQ